MNDFDIVTQPSSINQIIGVVTVFTLTFLSWHIKDFWIRFKSNRNKVQSHTVIEFIYRSLNEIQFWTKIPENRQVLQDALIILFNVFLDNTKALVDTLDKKSLNKHELRSELNKYLNVCQVDYHRKWVERGIPKQIMQKLDEKYRYEFSLLNNHVINICGSNDMYITYKVKIISFMDMLVASLADMNRDCLEMIFMENFNGNLKGVFYNKTPINDEDYLEYVTNKNSK